MKKQRIIARAGWLLLGWMLLAKSLWATDEKTFRIVILDKDQHSVVPDAQLKVYDRHKNLLEMIAKPGEYVVRLPSEDSCTFEVSAREYLPIRGAILHRTPSGIIQILLTRRPGPDDTQTVAFVAKDLYTRKPLGARFRLTNTQTDRTNTPTVTTAAHPEFGTELTMQQRYLLLVSSEDYEEYTASVLIKEKEPEPITPRVIWLRPLVYEVAFSFRDGRGLLAVAPERFEVREGGRAVAVRLEGSTGYATLRVGKRYEVRVEKNGYAVFERTLAFGMPSGPSELAKSILLVRSENQNPATPAQEVASTQPVQNAGKSAADEEEFDKLAVGESMRLNNVYFDQSSYLLRPESYTQLTRLAVALKKNPTLKIEIGGHTDNVGDGRLNQYLSENRAKVISSYLIHQGVAERQLVWKGYGSAKPIAPNDTEENRANNRRVELIVLEK